MMLVSRPHDLHSDDVFVDLWPITGHALHLKCEGFNFAGSVKLKAAVSMVDAAESAGALRPGSTIVESSSGNLGVALAVVSASRGYRFACVTDARCNTTTRRTMEALGADVHVVDVPHPTTGLLGARLDHVRALCARHPDHVWLNQYENPDNAGAHYRTTGPAIAHAFPRLEVLFVGAGTTGTLMGCARYFRARRAPVRVVAVDAEGSVTFGGPPAVRRVPGLGMSVAPPALDRSLVDDVVLVPETETLRACHRLAGHGYLFGGSTGTVVAGAVRWLAEHGTPDTVAVGVAPDLGERYLDTVYSPAWIAEHYGPDVAWGLEAERGHGTRAMAATSGWSA